MCGIIGYTGSKPIAQDLIDGITLLEYRGYDSAGIVVQSDSKHQILRSAEYRTSVADLGNRLNTALTAGQCGLAHTRWATHGAVNERNTHPHTDTKQRVAIVHNGIIENYLEIRDQLNQRGYEHGTDTDSELFAILIEANLDDGMDFQSAFLAALRKLEGSSTFLALYTDQPGTIMGAKIGRAGGLVIGTNDTATMVASDAIALQAQFKEAFFLDSREAFIATPDKLQFLTFEGKPLNKTAVPLSGDPAQVSKGAYPDFMSKEIAEQPNSIISAMRERVNFSTGKVTMRPNELDPDMLRQIDNVAVIGMGTSFHAAKLAAMHLESISRVHANAANASEYCYRQPMINERTLVIGITQSGETADTVTAMSVARDLGAKLIAVVENDNTQATRLAHHTLRVGAGIEMSVAATKTVTATMLTMLQFAIHLGDLRGTLSQDTHRELVADLGKLPSIIERTLEMNDDRLPDLGRKLAQYKNALYIARAYQYPIALEGALKLKEISYIHAEGMPAGELKHGTNALLEPSLPVVAIATAGQTYRKMLSNLNEIKSRNSYLIAVGDEGDTDLAQIADTVLLIPRLQPLLAPFPTMITLQKLAYQTSLALGRNPDRPRNLAKTVTVE